MTLDFVKFSLFKDFFVVASDDFYHLKFKSESESESKFRELLLIIETKQTSLVFNSNFLY